MLKYGEKVVETYRRDGRWGAGQTARAAKGQQATVRDRVRNFSVLVSEQ